MTKVLQAGFGSGPRFIRLIDLCGKAVTLALDFAKLGTPSCVQILNLALEARSAQKPPDEDAESTGECEKEKYF
jgi:hypothetical protein